MTPSCILCLIPEPWSLPAVVAGMAEVWLCPGWWGCPGGVPVWALALPWTRLADPTTESSFTLWPDISSLRCPSPQLPQAFCIWAWMRTTDCGCIITKALSPSRTPTKCLRSRPRSGPDAAFSCPVCCLPRSEEPGEPGAALQTMSCPPPRDRIPQAEEHGLLWAPVWTRRHRRGGVRARAPAGGQGRGSRSCLLRPRACGLSVHGIPAVVDVWPLIHQDEAPQHVWTLGPISNTSASERSDPFLCLSLFFFL